MPSKIKLVRIPLLIHGVLVALAALGSVLALFGRRPGVAFFVLIFTAAFAVVDFLTAQAVEKKESWSYTAAIVLGILMLFSFPIGTVLGILILIGIFSDEGKAWFDKATPKTPAQ